MSTLWLWGTVLVGVGLIALLAAIDSAVLAAHTSASDQSVPDRVRSERERTHRALAMARVTVYIATGVAMARALDLERFVLASQVAIAALLVVAVAVIVENSARDIGHERSTGLLAATDPLVRIVRWGLAAPVTLGAQLERALNALIPPMKPTVEERETSAEQFQEIVAAEAKVSTAEEELIHGVFSMGDTEVHEIMVPRVDIVAIERQTPWSEVIDRVRSSEHARFPVYDDTLDNVAGILYAKDLLAAVIADEEPAAGWTSLMRTAAFIPTSKHIDAQLREFQGSRTHIAIVSDEYGGTAGLVTIEDILEEIVGEIRDEYDIEEPEIQQEGATRFWVAGRVPLSDLADRIEVDFGVEDVSTVGGLVYELFGRVPWSGESITRAGVRIVVERVRRRRIERVYFERLEPVPTPDDE